MQQITLAIVDWRNKDIKIFFKQNEKKIAENSISFVDKRIRSVMSALPLTSIVTKGYLFHFAELQMTG